MTVTLRQTATTTQRLDCRGLLPNTLEQMADEELNRIPLRSGNRRIPLGELFAVERDAEQSETLIVQALDGRLDFLGAGLESGRIIVEGDAGDCTGRGMRDGSLVVHGNVGDLAGSGLRGGVLTIEGDAGRQLGAPPPGERQGQRGGVIHVRGSAGERAGERMRRGALIIEGHAGALLGYRMIAGTAYVGGLAGGQAGYGMHRGTLLLRQAPQGICPTLRRNGRHRLAFLPLLLKELQHLSNDAIAFADHSPEVERYLGDLASGGLGEMLILC